MAYPSTITTLTNPNATDRQNSPSHSSVHTAANTEITALETFIGTLSSVTGTLMYDIRAAASGGGGHVQAANLGGTGQTGFTKGDILVASSSSVISKLSVSSVEGYALITDSNQAAGMRWGIPGNTPTVRVYSSAVTIWTKPSNLSYVIVELVGGGGNGSVNIAGGGGGGYARKVVSAANLPVAASVYAGTASVMSYFGSVISATGGTNASTNTGGAGGIGTGGDINIEGSDGACGVPISSVGGQGGNSMLGGGGRGAPDAPSAGSGGNFFGGGGGGGAGGAGIGAVGTVIVYEY